MFLNAPASARTSETADPAGPSFISFAAQALIQSVSRRSFYYLLLHNDINKLARNCDHLYDILACCEFLYSFVSEHDVSKLLS